MFMETIKERAKEYVERHRSVETCYFTPTGSYSYHAERVAYEVGATEQKAIDDAILLKLKSAWEKEAQINHDDEANYKQGYHDAVEKSCKWLKKELRKLAMDELKDNFLENEFKFVLKSQIPKWLINFRKAMEK